MGCTSSAPSMTTTNPNATDTKLETYDEKNCDPIKKDAATMYGEEVNGINDIKVLTTCDTLAEPLQLDSNNKSMIDTSKLNLEKETNTDHVIERKSPPKEDNVIVIEEKMSCLEDVVEKVVELFVADNSISSIEEKLERKELTSLSKESHNHKEQNTIANDNVREQQFDIEPNEQEIEVAEVATSPSQSTSSRATRWEALADIAAELPPTLTVDPHTGQIYALSK